MLGGYGARGRSDAEADKIVSDAIALDRAGGLRDRDRRRGRNPSRLPRPRRYFLVPPSASGASAQCDGQVLVTEDMLGMFERVPRFVETLRGYRGRDRPHHCALIAEEVRTRAFPRRRPDLPAQRLSPSHSRPLPAMQTLLRFYTFSLALYRSLPCAGRLLRLGQHRLAHRHVVDPVDRVSCCRSSRFR